MLIPQSLGLEVCFILLERFSKDLNELSIILLQDRVLGAHVQRPALLQCILHAGVREAIDRLLSVVHGQPHSSALELVHLWPHTRVSGIAKT